MSTNKDYNNFLINQDTANKISIAKLKKFKQADLLKHNSYKDADKRSSSCMSYYSNKSDTSTILTVNRFK